MARSLRLHDPVPIHPRAGDGATLTSELYGKLTNQRALRVALGQHQHARYTRATANAKTWSEERRTNLISVNPNLRLDIMLRHGSYNDAVQLELRNRMKNENERLMMEKRTTGGNGPKPNKKTEQQKQVR